MPLASAASELVYTPVNPSFGGNPFNSSHLQSLATAQRQYDAPSRSSASSTDPLNNFSRTITSRLLSRISSSIADRIYGEDAEDSGQFIIGDTTIDFERVDGQVVINIADALTGDSTTVSVPVPEL